MTTPGAIIGKNIAFKVEELLNFYNDKPKKITFNAEYQRSFIWNVPKRQLLLDSMLRGWDINKIFLRQIKDGAYEVLDGQQRLKTIFQFMNGQSVHEGAGPLSLGEVSKDLGVEGRTVKDLKKSKQELYYKLLFYPIESVVIFQADDQMTSDIFLRLQEGIPLNSAEKLNATRGVLRNQVVQISEKPIWDNLGVEKFRFARRYLSAQLITLELDQIPPLASGFRISDAKFRNISGKYKQYQDNGAPKKVMGLMKESLNFLNKTLGRKGKIIKHKSDIIPIYLVASYLLRKYSSVQQKGDKFAQFVVDFLSKAYDPSMERGPCFDYRIARSRSTDARKSIEQGFKIMLEEFLKTVPNLSLKDVQRDFDYGQKLAIYSRDKGKCQGKNCGKSLRFTQAEYHHKKAWHKGGPTTVGNGLLLCGRCHDKQAK